jgi:hypothetical protein
MSDSPSDATGNCRYHRDSESTNFPIRLYPFQESG